MDNVVQLLIKLKLNYEKDKIGRILVSKNVIDTLKINNDEYIGKMLGFYC